MTAQTQYDLGADDLALVLALVRTGSLNGAAERLKVDASTAFRAPAAVGARPETAAL